MTGKRQLNDRRLARLVLSSLVLTVFLFFITGLPPGLSGHRGETVFLRAPVLQEALAGSSRIDESEASLAGIEQRIRKLLAPVYGEDHLVVQVSRDNETGAARAPVFVAIIIDSSVPGLPTSPDGLRVEQERLCNLVSHAVGLKGERGDSIAVSFLQFTGTWRRIMPLLIAGLVASLLVLCTTLLYVSRRRRINSSQKNDSTMGSVRKLTRPQGDNCRRLARRLSIESPQGRAVALGLLGDADAVSVLGQMPVAAAGEALACMASQSCVERDVLDLIAEDCLRGFAIDADDFVSGTAAIERAARLLSNLEPATGAILRAELARNHPGAWERLEPLSD